MALLLLPLLLVVTASVALPDDAEDSCGLLDRTNAQVERTVTGAGLHRSVAQVERAVTGTGQ